MVEDYKAVEVVWMIVDIHKKLDKDDDNIFYGFGDNVDLHNY